MPYDVDGFVFKIIGNRALRIVNARIFVFAAIDSKPTFIGELRDVERVVLILLVRSKKRLSNQIALNRRNRAS